MRMPLSGCLILSLCSSAAVAQTQARPESSLMVAAKNRIAELQQMQTIAQFEFKYICEGRIGVVYPAGHDLMLYLPTQAGASTEQVALESAFQSVFDWLDSDYMLPADPAKRKAVTSAIDINDPLLLMLFNRVRDRALFNVRYKDGVILDDGVKHFLLPFNHENCKGVPCAAPGSCSDAMNCLWEVHVPVCEFVNRGTAELLQRRYGALPQALLGFSEVVEVAVTGGHYAYRNWGDESPLLPHTERDGYAKEFAYVLKKKYAKKKAREPFLLQLLAWKGGSFSTERYASSWGMGQVLLGHLKTSGKGKQERNLGDLLYEIGHLEAATPEKMLQSLLNYDPKFLTTFKKTVSKKKVKPKALLRDD
jgi:hypothetical protein